MKKSDLTDKELRSLLNEIEDENDDMNMEEEASKASIEEGEDTSSFSNSDSDGGNRWQRANRISLITRRARATKRTEDRRRIAREAFDQDILPLSDPVGKAELKLLVSLVVKGQTDLIEKRHEFINNRATKLLSVFIPRGIKRIATNYPHLVRYSPGFLYTTSTASRRLVFWITPHIPYVLEQGREMEILKAECPEQLPALDEAIVSYHKHLKERQKQEVRCAARLVQKNVKTYYDILRLEPLWFELLYEHAKNNK